MITKKITLGCVKYVIADYREVSDECLFAVKSASDDFAAARRNSGKISLSAKNRHRLFAFVLRRCRNVWFSTVRK